MSYQTKRMTQWTQNDVISWIKSLPTAGDFNDQLKQDLVAGIENGDGVSGQDLFECEDASDVKGLTGVDDKQKAKLLLEHIEAHSSNAFDEKNGDQDNDNSQYGSEQKFDINIVGQQGLSITIKNVTRKTTISDIKRFYLDENGNSAAADSYRSNQKWSKGTDGEGKISFRKGGKSVDDDATLESIGIVNGLALPLFVGFHVIGGAEEKHGDDQEDKDRFRKRKITTRDFRKGQKIEFKMNAGRDGDVWMPGTINRVKHNGKKCVSAHYEVAGYTDEEIINERDYDDRIRLVGDEHAMRVHEQNRCSENATLAQSDKKKASKVDAVQTQTEDDGKKDKCRALRTKDFHKGQSVEIKIDGNWTKGTVVKIVNGHSPKIQISYKWWMRTWKEFVTETQYNERLRLAVSGQEHGGSENGDSVKNGNKKQSEDQKPRKAWNEKAMQKWNNDDVLDWVQSLAPRLQEYKDSIPAHMNGSELMDLTFDDLALREIIPKKLWRRRFMAQLDSAKEKYANSSSLDEDTADAKGKPQRKVTGVVGLSNLGNTCYMNSSVQILSQSPFISRYLAKRARIPKQETESWYKRSKSNVNGGDYPMLNAWTELCDIIYNQRGRHCVTASPAKIRDALNRIDPSFGSGAQDDSNRALDHMLQELDKEIEHEIIQKTGKKEVQSKDEIQIFHGRQITDSEEEAYIDELLRAHNPNNSILRKTFDGVERIISECLDCNKTFQQYVSLRIIDLPVTSREITFEHIHIVTNNNYYELPKLSMLDYCSVHLIKFHVLQYLLTECDHKARAQDIQIVFISSNGTVQPLQSENLSEVRSMSGSLFALVNESDAEYEYGSGLLQFGLCADKNANAFHQELVSYHDLDPREHSIVEIVASQIDTHRQSKSGNTKEYEYYVVYNNNVWSEQELQSKATISPNDVHRKNGLNVLVWLAVNSEHDELSFDSEKLRSLHLFEASERYPKCSELEALQGFKQWWTERKKAAAKKARFADLEPAINLKLQQISESIVVLQAKQNILDVVQKWMNDTHKLQVTGSATLTTLLDCLAEYEKARVLDESCYSYPCPHCNKGSKSQWVKVQREIVYAPSIWLFHLDRFGKKTASRQHPSYQKGDVIDVYYGDTKYKARIEQINFEGMKVRYNVDRKTELITASSYRYRIASNSSSGRYGSNKFEHAIRYEQSLKFERGRAVFDLYGVSNHSGTTTCGHYTATVQCLSDGDWYEISDSFVRSGSVQSALAHSEDATILAYVRRDGDLNKKK